MSYDFKSFVCIRLVSQQTQPSYKQNSVTTNITQKLITNDWNEGDESDSLHGAEAVAQVTRYQGHRRFYRAADPSDAHETPAIHKTNHRNMPIFNT